MSISSKSMLVICLILAVVATLLQIGAYVAPMWLWLQDGGQFIGIGLWYFVGCDNCYSNSTLSVNTNAYYSFWPWNVIRGIETACVISGVLLCIFLLVLSIGWQKWHNMRCLRLSAILMSVFGWFCVLLGFGFYCGFYWPIFTVSALANDKRSFPWSVVMSLIAGLIFFLVNIMVACCVNEHDDLLGIPVSGDSKMGLTPTVIDANNSKKYFVPTPYTDERRISSYADDEVSRRSYGMISDKPAQNGYVRRESYSNGYSNRGYLSENNDLNYNPTGYRPRSYAEPRAPREDDIVYRPVHYPSLERESRYVDRETRYQDREPVYSQYIERSRPPPAGARSVLPPIASSTTALDRSKYTDEVRVGATTSYMYRPYAPQRY